MKLLRKHVSISCGRVLQRTTPTLLIFRRALFLEIAKRFFFEGKSISPSQFSAALQNFMESRRNIPLRHFVYTGAAPYRAAHGEIQKNPRGGSRGAMTRSFSGR